MVLIIEIEITDFDYVGTENYSSPLLQSPISPPPHSINTKVELGSCKQKNQRGQKFDRPIHLHAGFEIASIL